MTSWTTTYFRYSTNRWLTWSAACRLYILSDLRRPLAPRHCNVCVVSPEWLHKFSWWQLIYDWHDSLMTTIMCFVFILTPLPLPYVFITIKNIVLLMLCCVLFNKIKPIKNIDSTFHWSLNSIGSSLRSGRDCRWGEWITSALFHPQSHDWGEALEQGTEPPTAPRAPQHWLPTAPGVCVCVCLFTTHCCVCVHLDGLNAEHKFQVLDTILGHTSFPFLKLYSCT